MDLVGVVAIVAVLVVGVLVGLWRRRTDGLIRDVAPAGNIGHDATSPGHAPVRSGTVVLPPEVGTVAGKTVAPFTAAAEAEAATTPGPVSQGAAPTTEVAAVTRTGAGVVAADEREEPGVIEATPHDPSAAGQRLDDALLRELGVGEARATLLQFSSAFCAPCRAVRRVSEEVAALIPGVRHVEVDAESHLEAVRALGIWRTPTLLVLDGEGRVAKRATGVPAKPQLIAALGEVL
ncbi:hypothetical protein Aab01nite_39830 [Paractinoplanes abujensis]|uniref:Thiol-disulfide isomerase/thioredoxin n=1 Tax=Paractinoplanes abujensis TaxID=882441 RepID=A0A7W7CTI1_9ACTN|nr:thioredoxin family protein [Actinoplanes abujensis]MBB4694393.1 thiol-disulfide isomerase/thioredoxin [Actinoplanes abujensis]GID20393.1 hypothetical protein Aab01nite_39830 [Actinoplanes abujensis]